MGLQVSAGARHGAPVPGLRMRVPQQKPLGGWRLSLYPHAREGGGCFSVPRQHVWVGAGAGGDPARAAEEAARRARGKLRRYAAANRLDRLGTLTYGDPRCSDPRQLREHVSLFFRALRDGLGGDPLPYVWVPELHKDGVHFHVHFVVGRYVPHVLIKQAWGRGFVHIKRPGDLPVGSGRLELARRSAGYLSKYVSKSFSDPAVRAMGMHRYDCAQGFQPQVLHLSGISADDVIDQACRHVGAHPERVWSSVEVEDWKRPPALWVQWA